MGLARCARASLLAGVATGTLITTFGIAAAQEAGPQDPGVVQEGKRGRVIQLQRLVVGAGVEKVATDTPQAVTVIDQEDIDREQATTVGDIFRETPGVNVIGSDRVFGEAFNIRGIGATENSADAARIVVTVDGAPKFNEQYRMGSFFSDPELYKKVEVLRGPASSTLYGSGALGGVINFVTKDASDFIAEGDRGAVRLKGSYETNGDGTLTSGILAHRFSENLELLAQGNWRRSDDFEQANGNTLAGSSFDAFSGLIKGTARFGDANEQVARVSYQRWQSDEDDQEYTQTGTTPPMFGFGTLDRLVTDETFVVSYENPASDNPWLDLNVNFSYSNTTNKQDDNKSPLAVNPNDPGQTAILFPTDYAYKTVQLKADNTFDYVGEGFENFLTVGFQASHQDRLAGRPTGAAELPAHPEGSENKLGLFVQNEFIWNERLTIIPGARVDFHKMSPSDTIPGATDIDGSAFSPKIAALYKVTDNVNVFGSIAHTERFPTLDELFSRSIAPPTLRGLSLDLKKESSNNYEGGVAFTGDNLFGWDNSVGVKVTGFYNDITDGIRLNPFGIGPNVPYYINVSDIQIYGVEIEGSYESEYIFGRLAYTHTEGEYPEGWAGRNPANTVIPGARLDTVPQDKLVLTLGARLPDYDLTLGATGTFAAEGDYILAAGPGQGDGPAESWTRVDLFASWKPQEGTFAGTEAQFAVQNVFNEDYRENLLIDRSKGRTFKFTLAKQFGYQ
jgi:hemoglobin/transferrin/lactoferrin receptor protein